jgi:methionine synthase II (cobalamin-independent)
VTALGVRNARYLKPFAARSVGGARYFRFQAGVSRALRIEFLEQSVKEYSQLIKTFEADRVRLVQLEASAVGDEAVRLRESVAANQRGLDLLEEALARVQAQLKSERQSSETD